MRFSFAVAAMALVSLAFSSYGKDGKDTKALTVPTLKLESVRELALESNPKEKAKKYLSAASGIVKLEDRFYVVSDDALSLFSFKSNEPNVKAHNLLSAKAKGKKTEKPDIESLVHLTPMEWPPHGALVAWPSASSLSRMTAVVVPFEKDGELGSPIFTNILPLAYQIQPEAKDVNMEGILIRDDKVFLFQRGNSKKGKNGIFEMPLANWIKGLKEEDWSGKIKFESIKLGTLSGVELTFTDAAWTKYGLLVLASAEDSESSFADGAIFGTVLARVVGDKGEIIAKFDPNTKLEGFVANDTAGGLELHLVEDSDNSEKASRLFRTVVPSSQLETLKRK
ncbi:MAG: hypothetical protein AB7T49_05550 [Oligoflexales bacterium]